MFFNREISVSRFFLRFLHIFYTTEQKALIKNRRSFHQQIYDECSSLHVVVYSSHRAAASLQTFCLCRRAYFDNDEIAKFSVSKFVVAMVLSLFAILNTNNTLKSNVFIIPRFSFIRKIKWNVNKILKSQIIDGPGIFVLSILEYVIR